MTQRAPVIVVGCQKGGVGRTALAVNLAAMLALAGKRTLLVDLDASGDATASVGLPRADRGKTAARLSEPWSLLADTHAIKRPAGLDVWTGGPALKNLSREIAQGGAQDDLLDRGLKQARQSYRAIVIDAPPDQGPLSTNAMACGDVLLVPVTKQAFLEHALEETITAALRIQGGECSVFGVQLQQASDSDADMDVPVEGPLGVELLESSICFEPETFNKAAAEGLPVFESAPGSRAARCFLELGREVVSKILDQHSG